MGIFDINGNINPENAAGTADALKGFGAANLGPAGTGFDFSIPDIGLQNQQLDLSIGGQGGFGGNPASLPTPPAADGGFGFFNKFDADGLQTQQGLLAPVLGGLTSAFNIYSGLKQLDQQEEALDFQKDSFNRNFNASKAAFENKLRGQFGRKKTLGGHKGTTEQEFVDERADF